VTEGFFFKWGVGWLPASTWGENGHGESPCSLQRLFAWNNPISAAKLLQAEYFHMQLQINHLDTNLRCLPDKFGRTILIKFSKRNLHTYIGRFSSKKYRGRNADFY
jgi:hypothetical protein